MSEQVLATPQRPYLEGTELVAVSAIEWEEAREAFRDVSDLQDGLANANAEALRLGRILREIADLHTGKHACAGTGGAHHWSMWAASETCPTRALAARAGHGEENENG